MLQFNLYRHKTYAEEVHRRIESDNDTAIDRDVFDGMEGELTQAHIDAGKINSCRECPVALALTDMLAKHRDQVGQSLKVEVNRLYIFIFTEDWSKTVLVAEISGLLDEWIGDYDDSKQLPPGNLYIEKDGLIDGIDGGKVQHWSVGMDVPDAYYIDAIGDDDTVNWGV